MQACHEPPVALVNQGTIQMLNAFQLPRSRLWRTDRRAVAALEFALIAVPFLIMLLFIFTIGFYLFWQEVLDTSLHVAVRQIQTGQAQNVANGDAFVNTYLCPASNGLMACNNIHVQVKTINFAPGQDYYDYTSTQNTMSGDTLNLAAFNSGSFCNSGPSQFILVTAFYLVPNVLGGLLPGIVSVKYNGTTVTAIMAQVAAMTENYNLSAPTGVPAPSC